MNNVVYQINDCNLEHIHTALDIPYLQELFNKYLKNTKYQNGFVGVDKAELIRYKPNRRFLVEYEISYLNKNGVLKKTCLIGKSRIKGPDFRTYSFIKLLWENGFGRRSKDNVYVPEPITLIPELNMWLQEKIEGPLLSEIIFKYKTDIDYKYIIKSLHKLHNFSCQANKVHNLDDELRLLQEYLSRIYLNNPSWTIKIENLISDCYEIASKIDRNVNSLVHRDFYHNQLIVSAKGIYFLDLDLKARGDSALDIGNFLAHIMEQSLRLYGDYKKCFDIEESFIEQYMSVYNIQDITSLKVYRLLSLARLIYISTVIAERREFTGHIYEICRDEIDNFIRKDTRKLYSIK